MLSVNSKNTRNEGTIAETRKLEIDEILQNNTSQERIESANAKAQMSSLQESVYIKPRKRHVINNVPKQEKYLFKDLSNIKYGPGVLKDTSLQRILIKDQLEV